MKILNILLAGVLLSLSSNLHAELLVVVHKDNPIDEISSSDLARLFLGKADTFSSGGSAEAVNHLSKSPAYITFGTKYLKRNATQLKGYWAKVMFSGSGTPPKELSTDLDVINYISTNTQAISYIDSGSLTDAVKAIVVN